MMKTISQACLSGASDFATVIELGFVPTKLSVYNATTGAKLDWVTGMTTKSVVTKLSGTVLVGGTCLSANGTITVIDGSDKVNYVTSSFGFLLPKITDLNDTAGEILHIVAERSDI